MHAFALARILAVRVMACRRKMEPTRRRKKLLIIALMSLRRELESVPKLRRKIIRGRLRVITDEVPSREARLTLPLRRILEESMTLRFLRKALARMERELRWLTYRVVALRFGAFVMDRRVRLRLNAENRLVMRFVLWMKKMEFILLPSLMTFRLRIIILAWSLPRLRLVTTFTQTWVPLLTTMDIVPRVAMDRKIRRMIIRSCWDRTLPRIRWVKIPRQFPFIACSTVRNITFPLMASILCREEFIRVCLRNIQFALLRSLMERIRSPRILAMDRRSLPLLMRPNSCLKVRLKLSRVYRSRYWRKTLKVIFTSRWVLVLISPRVTLQKSRQIIILISTLTRLKLRRRKLRNLKKNVRLPLVL